MEPLEGLRWINTPEHLAIAAAVWSRFCAAAIRSGRRRWQDLALCRHWRSRGQVMRATLAQGRLSGFTFGSHIEVQAMALDNSFNPPLRRAEGPCSAGPGTRERIEAYAARHLRGECLFEPGDAGEFQDGEEPNARLKNDEEYSPLSMRELRGGASSRIGCR
jgi:hypothetical protein